MTFSVPRFRSLPLDASVVVVDRRSFDYKGILVDRIILTGPEYKPPTTHNMIWVAHPFEQVYLGDKENALTQCRYVPDRPSEEEAYRKCAKAFEDYWGL
jgi:hypothetical protein